MDSLVDSFLCWRLQPLEPSAGVQTDANGMDVNGVVVTVIDTHGKCIVHVAVDDRASLPHRVL